MSRKFFETFASIFATLPEGQKEKSVSPVAKELLTVSPEDEMARIDLPTQIKEKIELAFSRKEPMVILGLEEGGGARNVTGVV